LAEPGRHVPTSDCTFLNDVAKYVATSTSLDRTWANTTVINGELIEFVRVDYGVTG
jgi:hypothetical protein